jgi:ribosomal-protein-alanine N-acetyltransferase
MPELREYRADDFDILWQLDQKCFPPDIAYSRAELAYYLRKKNAICLIAFHESEIIGFIVGHLDRRGFGHIVTLDVDPSAHRTGVGSVLIEAAEEQFCEAQCASIFLEVAVNNFPAISFYKKHGYSVLKTLRRYYPGDLDGLLMGKKLMRHEMPARI